MLIVGELLSRFGNGGIRRRRPRCAVGDGALRTPPPLRKLCSLRQKSQTTRTISPSASVAITVWWRTVLHCAAEVVDLLPGAARRHRGLLSPRAKIEAT